MKLKRQMLYYFTQIESNVRSELLSNLDLERELTKCNRSDYRTFERRTADTAIRARLRRRPDDRLRVGPGRRRSL